MTFDEIICYKPRHNRHQTSTGPGDAVGSEITEPYQLLVQQCFVEGLDTSIGAGCSTTYVVRAYRGPWPKAPSRHPRPADADSGEKAQLGLLLISG